MTGDSDEARADGARLDCLGRSVASLNESLGDLSRRGRGSCRECKVSIPDAGGLRCRL